MTNKRESPSTTMRVFASAVTAALLVAVGAIDDTDPHIPVFSIGTLTSGPGLGGHCIPIDPFGSVKVLLYAIFVAPQRSRKEAGDDYRKHS